MWVPKGLVKDGLSPFKAHKLKLELVVFAARYKNGLVSKQVKISLLITVKPENIPFSLQDVFATKYR